MDNGTNSPNREGVMDGQNKKFRLRDCQNKISSTYCRQDIQNKKYRDDQNKEYKRQNKKE